MTAPDRMSGNAWKVFVNTADKSLPHFHTSILTQMPVN